LLEFAARFLPARAEFALYPGQEPVDAQGMHCLEDAAELLIAQPWLHRDDFTSRFITVHPGSGSPVAVIDWPAVITALGSSPPCSGGERRMLKLTASIPADLRDTLISLDDANLQRLITAIRYASGKRPDVSGSLLLCLAA
jgi:hypothetical protein